MAEVWDTTYYDTPEWKAIRLEALKAANFRCSDCGERPRWPAYLEVHHLNYDRFGHERLSDLVALCAICHATRHPNRAEALLGRALPSMRAAKEFLREDVGWADRLEAEEAERQAMLDAFNSMPPGFFAGRDR